MKTKKRLLGILLSLVMMLGLMPGMSLTAYAEGETITVTWKSTDFSGQTHTKDGVTINDPGVVEKVGQEVKIGKYTNNWTFTSSLGNFTKIEVTGGWTFNNVNGFHGTGEGWSDRTWTGDSSSVSAYSVITDSNGSAPWTITFTIKPVNVTGVTLAPSTAQTINVGGSVSFTATITPNNATDKKVKWSTTGGVTLYSDENCTAGNEIGADATSTLTVYAKGTAAGSATVTVTTNDGDKTASCDVTVGKANAVAATITANNRTYDGTEKPLVTVDDSTLVGGTMQYALGKDATTAPKDSWSADIPKGTDAKTYHVWYMAKGDNTHNDSAPGVVSVTIKENTSAHTHTIKLVGAKDPTCTEDGYDKHYECTECGKWFKDLGGHYLMTETEKAEITKKATGHKWDSGVVTVEPTYDETGIKTYTCSVCGEIKEETIPKKTRSYSNDSDNDSSDSGSSGGGSGNFSTRSLDVNGNAFGGPSAGHQPDSGMPVSDRGGNWGSIANNWSYTKSDGTLARNEWLNLEYNGHTYWYFFDGNSTMQTDWLNYNGATYYFVPDMDGWCGRMATGWHQIGEKWYYFEPTAGAYQGVMYRGAVTPDGHIVGADGAWNGVGTTPESSAQTGTTASGT